MSHLEESELPATKFLLNSDTIEISGSEEFVSKQIELLKDSIITRLERLTNSNNSQLRERSVIYLQPSIDKATPGATEFASKDDTPTPLVNAENVFIITGQDVSIIADVPGASTAQRMINLILIYLYAKHKIGVEEIPFKELRDVCEKYGEIDKPNFSKILNSSRKYFLTSGESKNQSARLIRPGTKAAESLIFELNSKSI